jgi:hypothetical protein
MRGEAPQSTLAKAGSTSAEHYAHDRGGWTDSLHRTRSRHGTRSATNCWVCMSQTVPRLKRRDVLGTSIRIGDVVRVVGEPEFIGMSPRGVREVRPVFRHLVGRYKRIVGFDEVGHAELRFRIRSGRHAGWHYV